MDASQLTDPQAWAQETFGAAELGDPRRSRRLLRVAASMAADPPGSLPRELGGNWAALKAAYGLGRADGVTHEAISRPVWQPTRQQVEQEPAVLLIVHDDTEVDDGYGPAISGLGPLGKGNQRGFFVHPVLAVVPRGTRERVLGLRHQEAWVRQPAPREADGSKQSTRQRRERPRASEVWTRAVAQVGSPPEGPVWIPVADRYAERFACVQRSREMGTFLLVRAAQNRRVLVEEEQAEPELAHLLDRAKSWPAQAQGSIEVPSEPERRARHAQVQRSWGSMPRLPPDLPTGTQGTTSPLPLGVVRVGEPEPPSKKEAQRDWVPQQKQRSKKRTAPQSEEVEALEWILLSALPVESAEQAWQAVDRYASRWPMEDFHRGVKTGCRLEQRHLQEQRSWENLLAVVSPIAVRLLQWRNLCREEPEQPATKWVEPEEAQGIASQQGVALEQLTIEQLVSSVAQLGGFLRRPSDGPPGWQTLWDGWLRLRWFVAGMRFATDAPVDASARSPCING
jgi:hypothetical protein